jgi:uncharacterized SAM-binding protein YcdF (DUF218 family)
MGRKPQAGRELTEGGLSLLRNGLFRRKAPRVYRVKEPLLFGLLSYAVSAVYLSLPGGKFLSLMLAMLGAALLAYAYLNRLCKKRQGAAAFTLRRILQLMLLCAFLLISAVEIVIFSNGVPAKDPRAQYAILFGAGLNGEAPSAALASRLNAAQSWLSDNPNSVVVVSGGQGAGESIPEAAAMFRWLTARGVPESRILIEDQSKDTEENVSYSAALLENSAGASRGARVAVITNEFHLYRACRLVREAGFDPVAIPAETPYLWLKAAMYTREFCSVIFMWLHL